MTTNTALWAAFIAIAYSLWPILGKWSNASGQWVTTIVVGASFIPVAILSIDSLTKTPINGLKAFIILFAAGILNGFAVYVYGMKSADKTIQTGAFVMMVSVLFFVFAPIIDWALNGATLSPRQVVGVCLAAFAVYMLKS